MSIAFSTNPVSRISGAIIGAILGFLLGPIFMNPITTLIGYFTAPVKKSGINFLITLCLWPITPLIGMYRCARAGARCGLLATLKYIFLYTPQAIVNFNTLEISMVNQILEMPEEMREATVKFWNDGMDLIAKLLEEQQCLDRFLKPEKLIAEDDINILHKTFSATAEEIDQKINELGQQKTNLLQQAGGFVFFFKDNNREYTDFEYLITRMETIVKDENKIYAELQVQFEKRYLQTQSNVTPVEPAKPTVGPGQDPVWAAVVPNENAVDISSSRTPSASNNGHTY